MLKQTKLNLNKAINNATNFNVEAMNEKLNHEANIFMQNKQKLASIEDSLKTLKAEKNALKTANEQINQDITSTLDVHGFNKYETPEYTFKPRNYMPKVIIKDKGNIAMQYQKQRISNIVDKSAIKTAILSGKNVTGAELQEVRKTKITTRK